MCYTGAVTCAIRADCQARKRQRPALRAKVLRRTASGKGRFRHFPHPAKAEFLRFFMVVLVFKCTYH